MSAGGFTTKTSRAGTTIVSRPRTIKEEMFLPAVIKGLGVTLKHFFTNVTTGEDIATFEYPEEKREYPERNRGLHRLMHREDGAVRCVACMCCPTACPANCITIVAEETGNGNEKRPAIFEIDELRCVVCGLCVEACPCDAIRMDSGVHAHVTDNRGDGILGKNDLLKLGTKSIATQGGVGAEWRENLKK